MAGVESMAVVDDKAGVEDMAGEAGVEIEAGVEGMADVLGMAVVAGMAVVDGMTGVEDIGGVQDMAGVEDMAGVWGSVFCRAPSFDPVSSAPEYSSFKRKFIKTSKTKSPKKLNKHLLYCNVQSKKFDLYKKWLNRIF